MQGCLAIRGRAGTYYLTPIPLLNRCAIRLFEKRALKFGIWPEQDRFILTWVHLQNTYLIENNSILHLELD